MANSTQLPAVSGGVEAVTAVGTALSGAAALTGAVNNVTTAGGQTAVILPVKGDYPSQPIYVHNLTATTALVFPPSTSVQINQIAAGSSFSVAQNLTAVFIQVSATRYIAMLSA